LDIFRPKLDRPGPDLCARHCVLAHTKQIKERYNRKVSDCLFYGVGAVTFFRCNVLKKSNWECQLWLRRRILVTIPAVEAFEGVD
jgi:hypothetical protein